MRRWRCRSGGQAVVPVLPTPAGRPRRWPRHDGHFLRRSSAWVMNWVRGRPCPLRFGSAAAGRPRPTLAIFTWSAHVSAGRAGARGRASGASTHDERSHERRRDGEGRASGRRCAGPEGARRSRSPRRGRRGVRAASGRAARSEQSWPPGGGAFGACAQDLGRGEEEEWCPRSRRSPCGADAGAHGRRMRRFNRTNSRRSDDEGLWVVGISYSGVSGHAQWASAVAAWRDRFFACVGETGREGERRRARSCSSSR